MNRPSVHKHRRRSAVLASAAALAATAVSAVPASASLTGDGVRAGANITVFHNIDFVAVFGYGSVGQPITVEVLRDGVTIGTATGPAVDAEGLPGLEVNHGPEGPAVAGDCWQGTTPDIQPGDVVHVTSGGTTDEVTVDDIRFTGDPFLADGGDVLVPFTARRFDGTAVPASFIDSAEFRATSRLRFEATDILVQRAAGGAPGEYVMRYNAPFAPSRNRDLLNQTQLRQLLLGDGHAIGFGHTDPLPAESMLHDGLGDTPGPAPGCASPSAQWAVTDVTPSSLNLANQAGNLTVRGVSSGASAVRVDLTDADGTVVTKSGTPAAGGNWTISFASAELTELTGDISVEGFYTLAGGEIGGKDETLRKDLVAPVAPRASLPAGTYRGTQRIALRTAAGNRIRYSLGNGRQAAPTANRGTLYTGRRIALTSTQVLKMVAVDAAGNASPVVTNRYRIANVPSRPGIRRAVSGAAGGANTAEVRWRAASGNGSKVSGYRVTALRMRENGSVAAKKQSKVLRAGARSHEMRLRAGSYRFRVRAINRLGASKWSARSNAVRSR
jgi:Chitobiase/beta-hexosaminidase C-terminal domain